LNLCEYIEQVGHARQSFRRHAGLDFSLRDGLAFLQYFRASSFKVGPCASQILLLAATQIGFPALADEPSCPVGSQVLAPSPARATLPTLAERFAIPVG
jgi:hypothetical protein